jgi:hypothetical protein
VFPGGPAVATRERGIADVQTTISNEESLAVLAQRRRSVSDHDAGMRVSPGPNAADEVYCLIPEGHYGPHTWVTGIGVELAAGPAVRVIGAPADTLPFPVRLT